MGRTTRGRKAAPLLQVQKLQKLGRSRQWTEGAVSPDRRVFGTYVHGLFDLAEFRRHVVNQLRAAHGWPPLLCGPEVSLDQDLDRLADFVEEHLRLDEVEAIIAAAV